MSLNGKHTSMSICFQLVIRLLSVNLIICNCVIKGSPSEGQFINADKDYYNIMSNGSVLYNGTMLVTLGNMLTFEDETTFPYLSKLHHFGDNFLIIRQNYLAYAVKYGLYLNVYCYTALAPFNRKVKHLLNHNPGNESFGSTLHYFGSVNNFVQLFPYKISDCSSSTNSDYLLGRGDKIYLKHYPATFIGSFKFKNYTYTFKFRQIKGFEIIVGRFCNLLDFQTFDLSYTSLSAYCPMQISKAADASTHLSFSKLKSTVYISYISYPSLIVCALNLTEIDIKLDKIRTDCSQGNSTIYTGVATSQIPNHCLPDSSVFLCGSTFSGLNGAMYSNAINVTGKIILRQTIYLRQALEVHYFELKSPSLSAILISKVNNTFPEFKIVDLYYQKQFSPSFSGTRYTITGQFEGLDPVSGMAYYLVGGDILSTPLFSCSNYELTTCLYFSECKICSQGCLPITVLCDPVDTFQNAILPVLPSYAFSSGSIVSLKPVNRLIHNIETYQITFKSSDFTINCTNLKTKKTQIECETDSSESFIPFNTSFNVIAILTFQNTSKSITLTGNDTVRIVNPQYSAIIPNYAFPSHKFGFQIRFSQLVPPLGHQIKIFLGKSSCENSYDNNTNDYHVSCTYFGSPNASLVARVKNRDLLVFNFTFLPRPDSIRPLVQSLFPKAQLAFPIIGNNIQSLFGPKMAFRLDSKITEFKNCYFSYNAQLICNSPSLHTFDIKLPFTLEVVLESHGNVLNVSTPITVKMNKPPKIIRAEFDLDESILSIKMRYYYHYFINFTKIQLIDSSSGQEINCSNIYFSSKNLECKVNDNEDISGSVLNITLTVANYEQAINNVPVSETFVKINLTYLLVLGIILAATVSSNIIYRRSFVKKYKQRVRRRKK